MILRGSPPLPAAPRGGADGPCFEAKFGSGSVARRIFHSSVLSSAGEGPRGHTLVGVLGAWKTKQDSEIRRQENQETLETRGRSWGGPGIHLITDGGKQHFPLF